MYMWATSMMRDRNGNKVEPMTKEAAMELLKRNSVEIEKDMGYDLPYTLTMAKADYMGSSIADEAHLAKFAKDYLGDIDGYPTRAFDEFLAKLSAQGIPVDWANML